MMRASFSLALLLALRFVPAGHAQTLPAAAASAPAPVAVAILNFDAGPPGSETGKQVADALAALLSDVPGVTLVDRASMARTLEEHALNLSGLVDSDKAVQAGKIMGARLLVTGKVFALGKSTYVTAKIIGTETSLVEGVLVKGAENDDTGTLVAALADKLKKALPDAGTRLVAAAPTADARYQAAKAKLATRRHVSVLVSVKERHHGPATRPIDPALETEIKRMLEDCGVGVADPDRIDATPPDFVISGEALSEYAAKVGDLVSCSARGELQMTAANHKEILLNARTTERAADLSELIAGKEALQKAGHVLGLQVLEYLAANVEPPAPASQPAG
jgi:hypothetical protein